MRLWHSNETALALILERPTISFSTNTKAKNIHSNYNKQGLEKLVIVSLTCNTNVLTSSPDIA